MWEISEGYRRLLHIIKLVPLEDLGFWEPKVSECWKLSMQALLSFLVLGDASRVSGVGCNDQEASLSSLRQSMH